MDKILDLVVNIVKKLKSFKLILWIFIILILSIIVLYPILDANFLYYKRINNRINILDKVSKIDEEKIKSNKELEEEYNSILLEIKMNKTNSFNKIIKVNETKKNNLIKFIAGAWLLVIFGLIIPFTKDNKKNKRLTLNNIFSGIVCIGIGCLFGWIAYKIPTFIGVALNVILYQIILFYLGYCIATSNFAKK